jgi:hypothetical protein
MVGEQSDLLLRVGDVIFAPPKLVAQHAREFFRSSKTRRALLDLVKLAARLSLRAVEVRSTKKKGLWSRGVPASPVTALASSNTPKLPA